MRGRFILFVAGADALLAQMLVVNRPSWATTSRPGASHTSPRWTTTQAIVADDSPAFLSDCGIGGVADLIATLCEMPGTTERTLARRSKFEFRKWKPPG
jgi:hypothetical protein